MNKKILAIAASAFALFIIAAVGAQTFYIIRLNHELAQANTPNTAQPAPQLASVFQPVRPMNTVPQTPPSNSSGLSFIPFDPNANNNSVAQGPSQPQAAPFGPGGIDPLAQLQRMQALSQAMFDQDFDQAFANFDTLGTMPGMSSSSFSMMGGLQLREEPNRYVITGSLPGIDKGNVQVEMRGNSIQISAKQGSQTQTSSPNGAPAQTQSSTSSFQQSFLLPTPISPDKINTKFENGQLTVTIPKGKRTT